MCIELPPQGKTWSAPISTILSDVLRQGKKFPKPPFSFWFLVALYVCIGWSGLTYVTLNGPKLFEVCCLLGDPSGRLKPHIDLVKTVPAAGGILL